MKTLKLADAEKKIKNLDAVLVRRYRLGWKGFPRRLLSVLTHPWRIPLATLRLLRRLFWYTEDAFGSLPGGTDHVHCGLIISIRVMGEIHWMVVDTTLRYGCRMLPLAKWLAHYQRRGVDVYRFDPRKGEYTNEALACDQLMDLLGTRYGCRKLMGLAIRHVPILRLFLRTGGRNGREKKRLPFCSDLVSIVWTTFIRDPVPEIKSRFTSPGHIANAGRYICTLDP